MENSINGVSPKEKKRIKALVYAEYEKHGQGAAFTWVNGFNQNHVRMIPYEHCNGCECESPAIDSNCLICGQLTQRMSDNDIVIRGKKAIGFKSESEWQRCATDKDKARLEGFIIGAKFGLAAKF